MKAHKQLLSDTDFILTPGNARQLPLVEIDPATLTPWEDHELNSAKTWTTRLAYNAMACVFEIFFDAEAVYFVERPAWLRD